MNRSLKRVVRVVELEVQKSSWMVVVVGRRGQRGEQDDDDTFPRTLNTPMETSCTSSHFRPHKPAQPCRVACSSSVPGSGPSRKKGRPFSLRLGPAQKKEGLDDGIRREAADDRNPVKVRANSALLLERSKEIRIARIRQSRQAGRWWYMARAVFFGTHLPLFGVTRPSFQRGAGVSPFRSLFLRIGSGPGSTARKDALSSPSSTDRPAETVSLSATAERKTRLLLVVDDDRLPTFSAGGGEGGRDATDHLAVEDPVGDRDVPPADKRPALSVAVEGDRQVVRVVVVGHPGRSSPMGRSTVRLVSHGRRLAREGGDGRRVGSGTVGTPLGGPVVDVGLDPLAEPEPVRVGRPAVWVDRPDHLEPRAGRAQGPDLVLVGVGPRRCVVGVHRRRRVAWGKGAGDGGTSSTGDEGEEEGAGMERVGKRVRQAVVAPALCRLMTRGSGRSGAVADPVCSIDQLQWRGGGRRAVPVHVCTRVGDVGSGRVIR